MPHNFDVVQKVPDNDSDQQDVPKHKLALIIVLLVIIAVPVIIIAYFVHKLSQIH